MNILDQLVQGRIKAAEDMGGAAETPEDVEAMLDNVDLSDLSEEELQELAGLVGEDEEARPEEMGSAEGEVVPEELADKLSSATEFLGRVQANAFFDELYKLSQEEGEKKEEEEKKDEEDEKTAGIPKSSLASALSDLFRGGVR